ncbi:DUF6339 family protein [Streptosporangium pseudovulgare]|uniref:Uncharacterized protein n=1 Tax=Streptosporangium pseudovulgare TaxID=35765 RepID=A0ABQ2QPF1_9ACTN|nr:DUF6339 family protein [Streptosporangium pseudovulgare]GGP91100.1 hypothetical protein GCM10010140_21010 [Streptosporangium pseudovulgare]
MSDILARIGHLPDDAAVKFLTSAVLEQREPLPMAAVDRASQPGPWEAEPVRQLLDEAMKRFEPESRTAADAWLAPLLHATLRLTRREAADSRIWNHLALRLAPDYVFWRHPGRPPTPAVNRARFSGPFYSQTFSRLWWAAELFRNGPDYGPVVVACGNQDVLNTVLRLEVILHRPTAQAILRLLSTGAVRTGREVNALAQAVNTAGSTLAYEALAPDAVQDADSYRDWIEDLGNVLVPYDSLPDGPTDGRVPEHAVEALVPLFERLFAEAPVRGRPEQQETIE